MADGAIPIEDYVARVGQPLGTSDWIAIDQERIDRFADATDDWQFIHTDPERARETPLGSTIAHGFLTASLLSAMAFAVLPIISGTKMGMNYGFESLRFLQPVRSGLRVRGHFTLETATERAPGQWLSTLAVSVEIEGDAKPALVAKWLTLTIV